MRKYPRKILQEETRFLFKMCVAVALEKSAADGALEAAKDFTFFAFPLRLVEAI
jgi:hypothetical protein